MNTSAYSPISSVGHSGKGNISEEKKKKRTRGGVPGDFRWEKVLGTKEKKEVFWGDGVVPILECRGDYTIVSISPTPRTAP